MQRLVDDTLFSDLLFDYKAVKSDSKTSETNKLYIDPSFDEKRDTDDVTMNYNPNQPRDSKGRWTSSGGSIDAWSVGPNQITEAFGGEDSLEYAEGSRRDKYLYRDERIKYGDIDASDISSYAGTHESVYINEYLRHGTFKKIDTFMAETSGSLNEADAKLAHQNIIETAERIKSLTYTDTVKKPFSSFRSGGFSADYISKIQKGSIIADNGIMSTSLDGYFSSEYGEAYARESGGDKLSVIFRINYKEGQKGLYADRWAQHDEDEWIPAYGTELKVLGVREVTDEGKLIGAVVDTEAIQ